MPPASNDTAQNSKIEAFAASDEWMHSCARSVGSLDHDNWLLPAEAVSRSEAAVRLISRLAGPIAFVLAAHIALTQLY